MAKYERKPDVVDAVKCKKVERVHTPGGHVMSEVGDWIVTDDEGKNSIVTDALFK